MNKLLRIFTTLCFVFFFLSCKKDTSPEKDNPSLPVVITTGINHITFDSANSGGNVTIEAGTTINSRGVCWNTTGSPTIYDSKTNDGTHAGIFNSSISPLKINTKYFVRAYASSNIGTSYGNELTFTTPQPKVFIRAKFGNELLECYYSLGSVNNYYTYIDNPVQNRFYLVMYNNSSYEKSKEIQIDINRINIDTLRTPWETEASVMYTKTYISLYMVDNQRASDLFGIYDSINYSGTQLIQDPLFLKISGITGDTIEGTFHGTLKTKTGLSKQMTDGEFKIKFNRITGSWK